MSPSRHIVVRLRPGSDGDATQVPPQGVHTQVDPPLLYLEKIGQQWMESRGEARAGIKYVLERLPHGYTLWQRPRPSDTRMVDKYLWGHSSGRKFDSPNRFYPHFEYLMNNNGDSMGCPCTVCSGTSIRPKSSSSSSRMHSGASSRPATPKELSVLSATNRPELSIRGPPRVAPTAVALPTKSRSKLSAGIDVTRVDEEGTPDVYRNLIDRLRRYGSIDEAIEEPLSPDWRAEQECLPSLLDRLQQQESWVPRSGEIVLYLRNLPKDVEILCNERTGEQQLYSNRLENFIGAPQWEAGLVGQPTANTPLITELIENDNEQENVITYSGVRVEPIPNPNKDDKSISKRYKYVSLRQIRPFVLWRDLLQGTQADWHPTITNALTLASTVSLMGRHRFRGEWPSSKIYCHGLYLGFEMLAVGDTVRILPTDKDHRCTDVMVVRSIQLRWSNLDKASTNDYDDGEPYHSEIWLLGPAYTMDPSRANKDWVSGEGINEPPGAKDYEPDWYPMHPSSQEMAVPFWRVLGRLYERRAMTYFLNSGPDDLPSLDAGRQALVEARDYSSQHDQRIVRAGKSWWWGDDRADSLNLRTINGLDTARYDQERNIKEWRKNIKLIDTMANAKPAESSNAVGGKKLRQFTAAGISSLPIRQGPGESSDGATSSEDMPGHSNTNTKKRSHVINLSDGEDGSDDEIIRQSTRIIEDGPSMNKGTKKVKVEVIIR